MSTGNIKELSKGYEFADVEEKWLKTWEEQECFKAEMVDGKPSFSIVIPPPQQKSIPCFLKIWAVFIFSVTTSATVFCSEIFIF